MKAYYSSLPTLGLSRQLRRQRLGESLGMAQGTLQPWNLPEMRPLIERTRADTSKMMGYLPDILAHTGVGGPAAGLTLERAGEAGGNQLLNLMNQIRGEKAGQGLNLAQGEERAYQGLVGLDLSRYGLKLQKQQIEEQRKQAAWNRLMSIIKGVGQLATGVMSGIGSLQSGGSLADILKILQQGGASNLFNIPGAAAEGVMG